MHKSKPLPIQLSNCPQNMAIFIILITLLTIFFFFILLHRRKTAAAPKLPPRPPGLPLLGNLLQLGSLPHRSLNSLSKTYGPLILLQLGVTAPTVVVSSAEIAEQVMKAQDPIFASRPPSSLANHLLYNSTDVAFSPYNDYWRKMKKICIVHLLSSRRVQSYRRVREEEVALLVADIRAASAGAEAVNLSKRLLTLTNDIICRVALGRKYAGEARFGEALHELTELMGCFAVADFVPWLGWIDVLSGLDGRVRRTSKELNGILEQILEERIQKKRSRTSTDADDEVLDLVGVLLSVKDQQEGDDDAAIPLCNEHIKAVILDMFAGGTDTTFTVLEWAMAELLHHPTCMKNVQREIRDILGSKNFVEEEDINRLTYLNAIIKETLRLHVPAALLIPRVSTQNTLLQGYDIPAGTRIIINAWAIARDPNNWDRPEEFWPERFINSNIDFRGQYFQFIPFGAGRRVCPGIGFGMAIIECTLANLLHYFDWEVPKEMTDQVLDLSELGGITIRKKWPILLTAKLRYAKYCLAEGMTDAGFVI